MAGWLQGGVAVWKEGQIQSLEVYGRLFRWLRGMYLHGWLNYYLVW